MDIVNCNVLSLLKKCKNIFNTTRKSRTIKRPGNLNDKIIKVITTIMYGVRNLNHVGFSIKIPPSNDEI
jgi:hypothetical protein